MFAATSFVLGLVASVAATTYDIQVGGADGKLEYSPEAISAQPGDQVVFHFQQKNHTVTQSSFPDPCGPKDGGIDSGFMPVAANVTDNFPTYTVQVKDTQPMWFYCKQAAKTVNSHCAAGMVFAINCGQDGSPNSFSNFKASAMATLDQIKANASSSSSASDSATTTYTAAYGGATVPPPPAMTEVTQTVTLQSSTWTTSYTSYANSPAPTPASLSGNVIKVVVGGPGKLAFDPPRVSASPRDTIQFVFMQKNHTVTQSSFADPCRKISATNSSAVGFNSGFMPVADNATDFPTYNVTINDTAPVWAYCAQMGHCGSGMVFAVNSDESSARNFSAFQALAKQLNGTNSSATASGSGSTPSASAGTTANGAVSKTVGGAALSLVAAAVGAMLL